GWRRDRVPDAVRAPHVHLVELGARDRRVRRRCQRVRASIRRRTLAGEVREITVIAGMHCAIRSPRSWTLAVALLATTAIGAQPSEPVRASEQLVVAANPHASEAGRRILRAGGGAVDAAIATQLVLTLVEPQSSG